MAVRVNARPSSGVERSQPLGLFAQLADRGPVESRERLEPHAAVFALPGPGHGPSTRNVFTE